MLVWRLGSSVHSTLVLAFNLFSHHVPSCLPEEFFFLSDTQPGFLQVPLPITSKSKNRRSSPTFGQLVFAWRAWGEIHFPLLATYIVISCIERDALVRQCERSINDCVMLRVWWGLGVEREGDAYQYLETMMSYFSFEVMLFIIWGEMVKIIFAATFAFLCLIFFINMARSDVFILNQQMRGLESS